MMGLARRALKLPALVADIAHAARRPSATAHGAVRFLIYHSIAGRHRLELDIAPRLFDRHVRHLAATGQVISYATALARLAHPESAAAAPAIVLTFDDGYLDFYTEVFPRLQAYNLPATLFVTTGFVEERTPYPMLAHPHLPVEPVTWAMLGEMAASGLVTLGAHTHTHPVLQGADPARIEEELARPLELFQSRLGFQPQHFAYPRAQADATVAALTRQYYASAVAGGGHAAQPATQAATFDPYQIPRIPIRRSDGWWFFRAKVRGLLESEERLYAGLRNLRPQPRQHK